jgi:hypothetical protein
MRNTTFENFPIAITLTIPTYNTHGFAIAKSNSHHSIASSL